MVKSKYGIIINDAHKNKINDYLATMQHRCTARIIIDYDDLLVMVRSAVKSLGIPKTRLASCKLYFVVGACVKMPSSYNGIAYGTFASINFDKKGTAHLYNVCRTTVESEKYITWLLTENAINSFHKKFNIYKI